ncbi:MAG: hypothetical protein ABIJ09_21525 [Pseudomonadota bacterium]
MAQEEMSPADDTLLDDEPERLSTYDAVKLQHVLSSTVAKAKTGDRQAVATLARMLADREARAGFDEETRSKIVRKAFDGLRTVDKLLGKSEILSLILVLAEKTIAADVESLLTSAARGGAQHVLQALRETARSDDPAREGALQVLAQVRSQLNDGDYALIAWVGLRTVLDTPATRLIRETALEGKPATLAALEKTLLAPKEGGDALLPFAKMRAARLLCQKTEQLRSEWLPRLAELTRTGDAKDRAALMEALGAAATQQPPLAGAALAFVDAIKAIPPKVSFDRLEELRAVARSHLVAAFDAAEEAGDLEGMTVLAPLAIRRAKDARIAVTAAELLYPLVMEGDVDAIAALAETATRPVATAGEDACKLAVKMLEAAAKAGQSELVVQTLVDEAGRRGQNDDERGLEALGRTARHLPDQHQLLKPARAALRRGVKNLHPMRTRGHLSALRGMLALADRLRDRDIDTLMDHLGPQAGQVLAAVVPRLAREQLEDMRATLRQRLDKGLMVKGASEVLEAIEPVLAAPRRGRLSEAPPVLPRKSKRSPLKPSGKSLSQILEDTAEDDDSTA